LRQVNGWLDVPLNEASESYEVDVFGGAGQITRTLSSSSPSVTYTAARRHATRSASYANSAAAPPVWRKTTFWSLVKNPLRQRSIRPAMALPV